MDLAQAIVESRELHAVKHPYHPYIMKLLTTLLSVGNWQSMNEERVEYINKQLSDIDQFAAELPNEPDEYYSQLLRDILARLGCKDSPTIHGQVLFLRNYIADHTNEYSTINTYFWLNIAIVIITVAIVAFYAIKKEADQKIQQKVAIDNFT